LNQICFSLLFQVQCSSSLLLQQRWCNNHGTTITGVVPAAIVGCSEGEVDGRQFDHFTQVLGVMVEKGGAG